MTDVVGPPVRGNIRFNHPFLEPRAKGTFHYGTDFGPQKPGMAGDEIVAPVDGTLVHQYRSPSFGNTSVIERNNGDGTYSYFVVAHQAGYADKYRLSSQNPTIPVKTGDTIGYMGNTGTSSTGERILAHEHLEQINADGQINYSHGWPFQKGRNGTTDSGVGWQKVGSSFQLPNGWVATSDNGRMSVTVPSGLGSSASNTQRPVDTNVGAPAISTEAPKSNQDNSTPITPTDRIRNGFDAIGPRGSIGPHMRPAVPFLNPAQKNPLGNGNGIGDWRSNLAPAAPSIMDPASVRRLSSPVLDTISTDPRSPSGEAALPSPVRNAPLGLPGLLMQIGAFDPSSPDQPPAGGLLGLIQDYMRNNPDGATRRWFSGRSLLAH
jgi:murein DD-endopeptidase MepM/ murein hydrolase activator NlpD